MRPMEQPITECVGHRGFRDRLMPGRDRELSRDQGRGPLGSILQDFEQIASLRILERCNEPIVDREQVHLGEPGEQSPIGTVPAREYPLGEPISAKVSFGTVV